MNCYRQIQIAVVLLALSGFAFAQEDDKSSGGNPPVKSTSEASQSSGLGVRQDRVKNLVADLKAKFKELAKSKTIEPEQAERLIEALNKAAESQLVDRMVAIVALLNDSQLSRAADEQGEIIRDLKRLIEILTEDEDEREKEEKQLKEWREQVKNLITEETDINTETDKISDKDKTLDDLDGKIKSLENLIEKQKDVLKDTKSSMKRGVQSLDKVADQQRQLRNETKQLANEVAGNKNEKDAGDQKPGEGKPGEGKPGEGKPGEGKPGEGKPGEGKPGEGKPGEGKPGEGKPGEGKPGEGKPGEGKPGEGKPGEQQGSPLPGQKSLEKAIENQRKAEDNLGKGKGKAAEKDENKALANLNKALNELKNERNRIATLPPEALDKLAEDQDKTANKTGDLEKQMAEASKSGGMPGGQPGGEPGGEPGQTPPPQPGQQQIQQAKQQMQQASGNIKKKDPKKASPKQKKAVQNLQEALEEIERRLAQLREEMRADRLAKLEAHFRQMLAIQKPITATTGEMQRLRSRRKLSRPERLQIRRLGDSEKQLATLAQKALDMILEDGTSTVFPHVVAQLREDLNSTSALLDARKTGAYTQALQREIEQTLKELIEALEEAQKQAEEGDPPPPGNPPPPSDQQPPLLPDSAELKLLRSAQLRVNRRTKSFDDIRPDGDLDGVLKNEMAKIAAHQENVAEMTLEMVERN